MEKKVRVKGTLPLVAKFLDASEQEIYKAFGLDLVFGNEVTEEEVNKDKRGPKNDKKTTNKSKTIRTSNQSL